MKHALFILILFLTFKASSSEQLFNDESYPDSHDCIQLEDNYTSSVWQAFLLWVSELSLYLHNSSKQTLTSIYDELDIPIETREEMRNFSRNLFGEDFYRLLGYEESDKTEVGIYGSGEVNDKVRVSFMNGILSTKSMLMENLDVISKTHGEVNVHYVLLATEGWSADMAKMLTIKFGFYAGFQCTYAHLLADLWRKLIAEMGGVDNGGIIIHYAHSLGGTITDRARYLLTPEEQKMIRVTTFGTATLVENVGFDSVVNYVSIHDGVANDPVFIDPWGHFRNYLDPNSNVIFLNQFFSTSFWPVDHLLCGKTYRTQLMELGQQFTNDFTLIPVYP